MNLRSQAYKESVALLIALDDLMQREMGDSDEAEAIRDRMDTPWNLMSCEEQTTIRTLSADLYTLWDPPTRVHTITEEARERFALFKNERQWLELLNLLHELPDLCSPDDASRLRFNAWLALDEPAIAARFAQQVLPGPFAILPAQGPEVNRRLGASARATNRPRRRFPDLRRVESRA